MKKILFAVSVLVVALLGWVLWISFLNNRTTQTTVIVSGTVDEVAIYQTTRPDEPVVRIETGGQDTIRTVELRTTATFNPFTQGRPAQYYFVARAGEKTQRGSLFCCETGLQSKNGTLTIEGLAEWNFASQ
jgi:hypothetical protein